MAAVCAVSFASVISIKTEGTANNYNLLQKLDKALRQPDKLSN